MKYQTLIASLVLALVASPAFANNYRDSHSSRDSYNSRDHYKPRDSNKPRDSYAYNSSKASKYYLGLNGGLAVVDYESNTYTSPAFAFNAGYVLNEYLTAELTYANLGSMDLSGARVLNASGYSLGVVGLLPVSQSVALFGKLGVAATSYAIETNGVAGIKNSSVNPMNAIGVSFYINRKTDIRLIYDTYKLVDTITSAKRSLNVTSIGVLFRF